MFGARLISGIVLAIFALVVVISGGNILLGTLLVISLIGLNELYKVTKVLNVSMFELAIVGYLAVIAYFGIVFFEYESYTIEVCIVFLVLLMAVYVFTFPRYKAEQVMAAFFGVFYVAVMLSYIYKTRILADGQYIVWLIFICSWGCDTCAYCVGMLIGKHKLAPKLSPKKSIEGAIGGIVGAGLIGVIYALVVGKDMVSINNPVAAFAIIGAVGGVISQIGDLSASAIKRNHNIKDYGKLIPGHGGILDRFDSVIFTAPIIYIMAILLL